MVVRGNPLVQLNPEHSRGFLSLAKNPLRFHCFGSPFGGHFTMSNKQDFKLIAFGHSPSQCIAIVPRHPLSGVCREFAGMPLQLGHVLERVGIAQPTSVDEAHEKIARLGAVQRLIKQCVLSMKYSTLQSLFADVMPTPGLCRVGGFAIRPALFFEFAYAA
jgi:hypothetical protein